MGLVVAVLWLCSSVWLVAAFTISPGPVHKVGGYALSIPLLINFGSGLCLVVLQSLATL